MNHVVIMAGGIGSRFWPISTPEYPKQFIDILDCGRTLIQLTFDRFMGICSNKNFWIVTNEKYVDIVRKQVPYLPLSHILAEPAARNTAPCIAWACWNIYKEDSDANVIVTPSDAVIMNSIKFQQTINSALDFTKERNRIITIGITPNRPETGYGYIHTTNVVCNNIHKVTAFKEKPNKEMAETYVSNGNYLWNAGIFVWNVNTIINCFKRYKPQIAAYMDKILRIGNVKETFPLCENISIDFAIIEPAAADGLVFTIPADFDWSDLGNWQSLHEKLSKDEYGNSSIGKVHFFNSSNNTVHIKNAKQIIIQGLNGYIISENEGHILICKRSEEQNIKKYCALNNK